MHWLQYMTVITVIFFLVIFPAAIGYCLYTEYLAEGFDPSAFAPWHRLIYSSFRSRLAPGDFLIYRKTKSSTRPGPRARNVQAAENGDDYWYEVDKFWTLSDVRDDGRLVATTRTGKQIVLDPEDERLRKARLFERLRYRTRFPAT